MNASNLVFVIVIVFVVIVSAIIFSFFSVWLRAWLAGAPVGEANVGLFALTVSKFAVGVQSEQSRFSALQEQGRAAPPRRRSVGLHR